MPRQVWHHHGMGRARARPKGAHMSPVSPNPWSSTTAGPRPPDGYESSPPSSFLISRVRKSPGNGVTCAAAGHEGDRPNDTDQNAEHGSSPPMGG